MKKLVELLFTIEIGLSVALVLITLLNVNTPYFDFWELAVGIVGFMIGGCMIERINKMFRV